MRQQLGAGGRPLAPRVTRRSRSSISNLRNSVNCTLNSTVNTIPRLTGRVMRGLLLSQSVCCSRTKIKGGSTMIGVALNTRLNAVSPTANVAAFLLFPKLCTSLPSRSFWAFSSSVSTGNTSIPCLISSPRIKKTLRAPAEATAAKGTSRVSTVLVLGDNRFSRGTTAIRPRATEHDADTARK